MTRQCPSCGGFCKRSGCERANVEVKSAAGEEPVGYWQGKFSLDGGATLYEVPQVSAFGRSYPNIPLWEHPAPAVVQQPLTDDEINGLQLPESGTGTIRDLVRVVELAHGIGGSDE